MKRILIALFLLVSMGALTACQGDKSKDDNKSSPTVTDQKPMKQDDQKKDTGMNNDSMKDGEADKDKTN